MKTRVLGLSVITIGLIAVTSCSKIEEPWVKGYKLADEERSRSTEQQMQLRNRLVLNQVDDRKR